MKKFTITLLILFLCTAGFSQRFIGTVIFGGNATQVNGDQVAGFYKFGVNAGMSVSLPLDNQFRWFGTIELLYSQKGAYQSAERANAIGNVYGLSPNHSLIWHNENRNLGFNDKIKYKLVLDYVEVPVVFHYEDPRSGCSLGAGFAWGRLVRAKEIENGWTTTTTVRSGMYHRNDWSVIADARVRLYKGLRLGFRFQYSMVPLRVRLFNPFDIKEVDSNSKEVQNGEILRKQYNYMLTLRLTYSFNEKFISNPEYVPGGKKGPKWVHDTSKGWYR